MPKQSNMRLKFSKKPEFTLCCHTRLGLQSHQIPRLTSNSASNKSVLHFSSVETIGMHYHALPFWSYYKRKHAFHFPNMNTLVLFVLLNLSFVLTCYLCESNLGILYIPSDDIRSTISKELLVKSRVLSSHLQLCKKKSKKEKRSNFKSKMLSN